MPDYLAKTGSALAYRRACTVLVSNPLPGTGQAPSMVFHEEDVIGLADRTVRMSVGGPEGLVLVFQPGAEIDEWDPVSDTPTGQTISHLLVRQVLYSAYRTAAAQRDARAQEVPLDESTSTPPAAAGSHPAESGAD